MYYVIKKGPNRGLYTSKNDIAKILHGCKKKYKSFYSKEAAENYLTDNVHIDIFKNIKPLITIPSTTHENNYNEEVINIYVDGSYIKDKNYSSYGILITDAENRIMEIISGVTYKYVQMGNIAGELYGAAIGVKWAVENKYKNIRLHFDYEGIEGFVNGSYSIKKPGPYAYYLFMRGVLNSINIEFCFIPGHSGNIYNDIVDSLAKSAGIKESIRCNQLCASNNI